MFFPQRPSVSYKNGTQLGWSALKLERNEPTRLSISHSTNIHIHHALIYSHIYSHAHSYQLPHAKIYANTHMNSCMLLHIYACVHTYSYMHIHMHSCVHTCTHSPPHIHVHSFMSHKLMHAYLPIHSHVHTYTCIHIHTLTHTYLYTHCMSHILMYVFSLSHALFLYISVPHTSPCPLLKQAISIILFLSVGRAMGCSQPQGSSLPMGEGSHHSLAHLLIQTFQRPPG